MSLLKRLVLSALGLAVGLVILFGITWLVVHYTPKPISTVGSFVEKFAQPHS